MARKKKKNSNSKPITAYSKATLVFLTVVSIAAGLFALIASIAVIIFLPVAILLFWCAYACIKEQKRRKVAQQKAEEAQREREAREAERQREKEAREAEEQRRKEAIEAERQKYIYLTFKVVGVTFKNGRKTRQAILRAFKWGDEEMETLDYEPYTYEGRPAVYVKINDKIIGNIPSEYTERFLELERLYHREHQECTIYGGHKKAEGGYTNYGCEITLKYFKGEA